MIGSLPILEKRGGAIVPPLFLTVSNSTLLERNDFMATFKDVKEKYIDYLMDMDLNKMSVMDLSTYGLILKTVDEMEKPNYAESITSMMASLMPVCAGKSANASEVYGIG